MVEAGQGYLGGPRAAADLLQGFVHQDGTSGACHCDRRRQTIGTGADNNDVRLHNSARSFRCPWSCGVTCDYRIIALYLKSIRLAKGLGADDSDAEDAWDFATILGLEAHSDFRLIAYKCRRKIHLQIAELNAL